MTHDGTVWHPVPDFPDYAISNRGEIRRATPGRSTAAGKMLKSAPNAKGYHLVTLRANGKTHTKFVHDLVARTFLKVQPGFAINHINRDRNNNAVDNLEVIASQDNSGHGRLSNESIRQILKLAKAGALTLQIANRLQLRPGVVEAVIREFHKRRAP